MMRMAKSVPLARSLLIVLPLLMGVLLLWRVSSSTAMLGQTRAVVGSAEIAVQPVTQSAEVGDLITVTLRANSVTDPLNGFEVTLTFDDAVLRFNGVISAEFITPNGRAAVCPPPAQTAGSVRFACATSGAGAGATGSGSLAILTFEAIGDGTSDLTLTTAQLADTQQPPAAFDLTLSHSQIAVGDTEPPSFDVFVPIVIKE